MCADSSHDLHAFMKQISSEMAAEYNRIYAQAANDPGTAGDEGESNWASLLREWIPQGYHVETKGRLIGTDGTRSSQVDVIILKPAYPPKLLEKKIWLAGGVAAVFECKTTLKAAHLISATAQSIEIKNLFAQRKGSPRKEMLSPVIYGVLAHSHSWKGVSSNPVEIDGALKGGSFMVGHPRLEMDLVCVADLGTWTKMYMPALPVGVPPNLGPPVPHTAMSQHVIGGENGPSFQPIGMFISYLTQRLAYEDSSIRDIAEYYRLAQLDGAGHGSMRQWPQDVLSPEVQVRLAQSGLAAVGWDEFAIVG